MNELNVRAMLDSFGFIFLLSQRIEYITDRILAEDDLTTKQLLTLIAIEEGFQDPPSISDIAEMLSTTHQNVKKIAVQLEKKGFIEIFKDERDRRRSLLKTTKKSAEYWKSRAPEHLEAIQRLFTPLSGEELRTFAALLTKLLEGVDVLHREKRESKNDS